MRNALAAEALKLRRHKATWFLVWIYPLGLLAIVLIALMIGLAGGFEPGEERQLASGYGSEAEQRLAIAQWAAASAGAWQVPVHMVGRMLISAFVAVVFAGEYGWNTWKLVIPHQSRSNMIAAKFTLIIPLFATAYAMTGVITVLMMSLEEVPVGLTLGDVLRAHGIAATAAMAPVLLTISYTALAAILTRSMIAALVIGMVVVVVEQAFVQFGPALSSFLPGTASLLYHGLPGYHLANLEKWITEGVALQVPLHGNGVVALSWITSLVVSAAWIIGLISLTFAVFRKQDLN